MLLEIDDLAVSRGGHRIVHNVHLELAEGQIYGLLGPNGAGKSSTIAATVGLLAHDAGSIQLFGQKVGAGRPDLLARLGVLPERSGFYDWMSAEDYLRFFAALYGRQIGRRQVATHLERVGLDPRPGQAIGTFSQGMRQRLGLARALVAEPELLILDEPTNGLDPRGRREIHDILIALSQRGVGILLCTHLLDDVERLCQRVGVIVAGRTVAEGSLQDLLEQRARRPRYRLTLAGPVPDADDTPADIASIVARQDDDLVVDLASEARPESAWRDLLRRGWPIVEVHRQGGGLEALYLTLTAGDETCASAN